MVEYIETNETDFIEAPLSWQKRGLQQTASGYGSKLTTTRKINYKGKLYRVYAICYSNAASFYVLIDNKKMFLR